MDKLLAPLISANRPRGPRPLPHTNTNRLEQPEQPSTSSESSPLSFSTRYSSVWLSDPLIDRFNSAGLETASSQEQSVSSWLVKQRSKVRYVDYARPAIDLDILTREHMDREEGDRRVIFVVEDDPTDTGANTSNGAQGPERTNGVVRVQDVVRTSNVTLADESIGAGRVDGGTEAETQMDMDIDVANFLPTGPVSRFHEDDTMSTHSSMPDLIPISASEMGNARIGNGDDDDFLDIFNMYTEYPLEREPVTAEEIYESRLFAEDEMLMDPIDEARVRAIWAEVDRVRMPLPSDTSSESETDSDKDVREEAEASRLRREFPSFHCPPIQGAQYPPSDSDETEIDFDDENQWDVDEMFINATGLNDTGEYETLSQSFQNELASREMARNGESWYTHLPMDSPDGDFGVNADGETLQDLQSFLNLESPGMETGMDDGTTFQAMI